MKRKTITRIVAALMIAVMALTLASCGSSPDNVVKTFFDSIDKQNVKQFKTCFDKDSIEEMEDEMDNDEIKEYLEIIDDALSDEFGKNWRKQVKIGKPEKDDDEYEVDITIKYEDEDDGDEHEMTFIVVKDGGKYYLDEDSIYGLFGF
jgi:hypothetical protein